MNLLSDIITYIRRIVKTPNNASISDSLIIDYINRFWIIDVNARMQLFDLRTKYQFQTRPGVDQYNMPLYGVNGYVSGPEPGTTPGSTVQISYYPVYQGFLEPCFINGIRTPFMTDRGQFFNGWATYTQQAVQAGIGNGGTTYTLQIPFFSSNVAQPPFPFTQAMLRGHVDITGIIATNSANDPILVDTTLNPAVQRTSTFPAVYITSTGLQNQTVVASDSGQFLSSNVNLGLLTGSVDPSWATSVNTVNYTTGLINVTFNVAIAAGAPINVQFYYYQPGIPRAVLFYNNILTLRPPPNTSYLLELDAYLSPAAFLNTSQSIPFAYMSEYIARGAARKILSDTGDIEQFQFYEPLFREQEILVWKRSQRQFTSTPAYNLFNSYNVQTRSNYGSNGGSA